LAVLLVTATLGAAGAAEHKAIVTADRVNVRGQATLNSEIVTQLREGEEVVVIKEIPVKNPQAGEPPVWMRIQLPANTPVWVFAPYVEPNTSAVNVSRLNLRAGPGENYSVLGRVERGTAVKSIRVEKNWMEIEAPREAHAFVASNFLKIMPTDTTAPSVATTPAAETQSTPPATATTPADTTAPDLATTTPAETVPVISQPIEIEPAPVAAVDPTTPSDATQGDTATTTTPTVETVASETETPPRRVVSREGRVIISRSIQAPTDYALESLDTRRTINYLHSEDLGVNLKVYAGRKVIVEGEELLDKRWSRTPIVEVERIRLVP
jgi:uncharacterized protein YgiM (DUF1202 family)